MIGHLSSNWAALGGPLLAILVGASTAQAAPNRLGIDERLLRIEREVEAAAEGLGRPALTPVQLFGGGNSGSGAASAAQLTVRLDSVEGQMRQLTGQVEQLAYQMRQIDERLREIQAGGARPPGPGVPARPRPEPGSGSLPGQPGAPQLGAAQPGVSGPGSQAPLPPTASPPQGPGAVAGQPSVVPPGTITSPPSGSLGAPPQVLGQVPQNGGPASGQPLDLAGTTRGAGAPGAQAGLPGPNVMAPSGSPKDQYDLAYGYILRSDYELAESGFREFLERHPADPLAGNAQFYFGESLFKRGKYRDAADAYLKVFTQHPNIAKAPESLVKLAASLRQLNETEAACAALAEFGRKYPRAPSGLRSQVQAEQRQAGCS